MPSLKERLAELFRQWMPTQRRTIFNVRTMPSEIVGTLDVNRVAEIINNAQSGNLTDLFALYRDMILAGSHLQGRFSERKEAVLGDTLSIQPFDKRAAGDKLAAAVIDSQIGVLPSWEAAMLHLLDSTLYPVAVVEKVFRPSTRVVQVGADQSTGVRLRYELAELVPVPHELLDFSQGTLRIRRTDAQGNPGAETEAIDPSRYIVHRGHTLSFPDSWGGPLRSLVFWWLLGTMDREWWGSFLDRHGMPFVVGKYDQADDASRVVLQSAFAYAKKLGGLVVSRETDIEIKQAATADAGEAFEVFHRICNEEISKLVTGQTLSSDAKATGMGSGVADAQNEMRQDKRQADARRLGATLRFQLFEQILRYNGIGAQAPMAIWGTISVAELKAHADWLSSLRQGGLRVGESGLEILSERFGLPIEREPTPAPMPGGIQPMSIQLHSAGGAIRAGQANQAIMRAGAARLAHSLGKTYAPLEALILSAPDPQSAMASIETYCATLDAVSAAEILEQSLAAFAANGSATAAS